MRPSIITSSLLAVLELKPRGEIAQVPLLKRATCTPSARSSASAIVVTPGAADVVAGDDGDSRGRGANRLRPAGRRGDVDPHAALRWRAASDRPGRATPVAADRRTMQARPQSNRGARHRHQSHADECSSGQTAVT